MEVLRADSQRSNPSFVFNAAVCKKKEPLMKLDFVQYLAILKRTDTILQMYNDAASKALWKV